MKITELERFNRANEFSHRYNDDPRSQKELCLEYLKEYGSVTPLEALSAFNSLRLSYLIFRLRNDGYDIETQLNDDGKPFAIYILKGGEE